MYSRRYNKCCSCNKCNNSNSEVLDDILEDNNTAEMLSNYTCDDYDSCECGFDEGMQVFPNNAVLAQSYVPYQYMDKTFKPCVGLKMGTIFPELVSPYMPCQGIEEIEFIKATNKIGKGCNR